MLTNIGDNAEGGTISDLLRDVPEGIQRPLLAHIPDKLAHEVQDPVALQVPIRCYHCSGKVARIINRQTCRPDVLLGRLRWQTPLSRIILRGSTNLPDSKGGQGTIISYSHGTLVNLMWIQFQARTAKWPEQVDPDGIQTSRTSVKTEDPATTASLRHSALPARFVGHDGDHSITWRTVDAQHLHLHLPAGYQRWREW